MDSSCSSKQRQPYLDQKDAELVPLHGLEQLVQLLLIHVKSLNHHFVVWRDRSTNFGCCC
jgi:hypothetical protein